MGRQVTFFPTEADASEFTEYVHAAGAVLLPSWSRGQGLFDEPIPNATRYVCRSEDLADVVRRKVQGRDEWTVDSLRAPVVEWSFTTPGLTKTVGKCRLWYATRYFLDNDIVKDKPLEFVKFGDGLCRWVRRWGTYREELGGYLAPGALPLVPPRGPRWLP